MQGVCLNSITVVTNDNKYKIEFRAIICTSVCIFICMYVCIIMTVSTAIVLARYHVIRHLYNS